MSKRYSKRMDKRGRETPKGRPRRDGSPKDIRERVDFLQTRASDNVLGVRLTVGYYTTGDPLVEEELAAAGLHRMRHLSVFELLRHIHELCRDDASASLRAAFTRVLDAVEHLIDDRDAWRSSLL